jgi:hypothetical protein
MSTVLLALSVLHPEILKVSLCVPTPCSLRPLYRQGPSTVATKDLHLPLSSIKQQLPFPLKATPSKMAYTSKNPTHQQDSSMGCYPLPPSEASIYDHNLPRPPKHPQNQPRHLPKLLPNTHQSRHPNHATREPTNKLKVDIICTTTTYS